MKNKQDPVSGGSNMKMTFTNPARSTPTVTRASTSLLGALLLAVAGPIWAQSVLNEMSFSTGSGGAVEIILSISGGIPEPQVFTTDNPARIAMDLANTTNAVARRSLDVGTGATRSVTAVEAGGRTRVVIDLFRSAPFETRVEGDRLVVSISGGGASAVVSQARRQGAIGATQQAPRAVAVDNVDFRRGRNGEGRIVVNFTDAGANVDLSKLGNRLRAYIYNADIAPELEQRLDVLDFATPVDLIDIMRDGNRIRMDITVSGEYEHLAYQTGSQYVIEVQEFVEELLTPEELILQPPEYSGTVSCKMTALLSTLLAPPVTAPPLSVLP